MNSPSWPTILELPADRNAQPAWLDHTLLSPDLADSIHALRQIHQVTANETPTLPPVEQLLGSELDRFLNAGFSALSAETVAVLLQNPELLFDLQELVLLSDSEHWSRVLRQETVDTPPQAIAATPTTSAPPNRLRGLLRLAATLAVVALGAVLLWQVLPAGFQDPPGISGVGLGTRGLFEQNTTDADQYLQRMAIAVETLLQESDLSQQSQLVDVLQKTIRDCEIAIAQPHPVLAQRTLSNGQTAEAMFRLRCQAWKDKLSETLATLQQGTIDVPAAGKATAETLQKLINRLRDARGAEGLV